jgi:predicted Zn-dependent peptidase
MKKGVIVSVVFLFLLSSLLQAGFSEKVKTFTLKNGMKFFVYERHQIPTFAGMIMAKVGSVDERDGETGIAHFFEHMAFKGTPVIGSKNFEKEKIILEKIDKAGEELSSEYEKGPNANQEKIKMLREDLKKLQKEHKKYVVKDEIDKVYSENGGEFLNASTSNDSTQYFVMLPANRLELWFLIESERFRYPAFREFYSERDVIAEERRMFEDNNPVGFLWEKFFLVAITRHPYRHSVVGYMEDIQTYTKPKTLRFFKTFYIPNNMQAAIVGDVKYEEVKLLAEKYFEDIPGGDVPPGTRLIEPEQKGERRVTVSFDAEPRLMIGYQTANITKKEDTTLELIDMILSRGASSRLTRDLVNNKKLAVRIYASANYVGRRYPSLFVISAQTRHPHTPQELESAIYEHLDRLKTEPVNHREIEKVINQAESSLYRGMNSNIFIAMRLLWGSVLENDVDAEFKQVEALKQVTSEDIMKVAKKFFVPSKRTVGTLLKKEKGGKK